MQSMDHEVASSRERMRDMERNLGAAALLKAEQEALLFSLRKDLRMALESKEELMKKIDLYHISSREDECLKEKIGEYEQTVNSLQNLLDDKSAMVTRLRQESQVTLLFRLIICLIYFY